MTLIIRAHLIMTCYRNAFASKFESQASSHVTTNKDISLKHSRAVEIPVYSFVLHQRTHEKKYMYGPAIVIVEGIFVLHDPATRDLLDLKIFVQADSDLMLARRIKRDILERGRDITGILDQYLRFVKPSMDNFVQMTSKYADIIVPGQNNAVAIDVICQQIRRQLELRDDVRLRHTLSKTPAWPRKEDKSPLPEQRVDTKNAPTLLTRDPHPPHHQLSTDFVHPLESQLPPNVHVLPQTPQLRTLLTIMHDITVAGEDFVFTIDRLSNLVMEESMKFLPHRERRVEISSGQQTFHHVGTELAVKDICSVSILRSGTVLEASARRVLPALTRGTVLIQSAADGEARLYTLDLPPFLKNRKRAESAWVMVLDSQIGTGAAALMCIRVMLDHGVPEENIIFCCLLASVKGGVHVLHRAFPKVRIVVAGVNPDLKRRIVWEPVPETRSPGNTGHHIDAAMASKAAYHGQRRDSIEEDQMQASRVCFAICPGAGNIGDRYFGTTARPRTTNEDAITPQ